MRKFSPSLLSLRLILALPLALFLFGITACSSTASIITSEDSPADTASTHANQMLLETYQPNPGTFTVGEIGNLSLVTRSDRELPLTIYYPEGQGPFPTIIFSHGAGASREGYALLARYWASHGYVSIHPAHADSAALRGEEINRNNFRQIISTMLADSQGWIERAEDIKLIIDSLDELEQRAPQLQGKIDAQRIGVGGHSYGAYTTQLISGAQIQLPDETQLRGFQDPRVQAALLLSPQGIGQQGLTASSWDAVRLPMMVMTGSRDQGAQGQGPDWKRQPFDYSPPGNKYLILIEDANHFSFSGRLTDGNGFGNRGNFPRENRRFGGRLRQRLGVGIYRGDQEAIFDYVKIASLAFWDTYLKSDENAEVYLNEQVLEDYSQGKVSIFVR